jgi:hypothetical protein
MLRVGELESVALAAVLSIALTKPKSRIENYLESSV